MDCTQQITKKYARFHSGFKIIIKSHIQNLTNVTQISSYFEFDSDENSEISYIIASSSVHEDGYFDARKLISIQKNKNNFNKLVLKFIVGLYILFFVPATQNKIDLFPALSHWE